VSANPQQAAAVCRACGTSLSSKTAEALCPRCLLEHALRPNGVSDPKDTLRLDRSVPSSPFTGTRLRYFGDYELLDEIARGGMGIVFKARQASLNRLVALKLISAGALATEDLVKRFKAEAEAAASLSHPNIVPIHEIGEHQGQHYFSMGLIDGPNLDQYLARIANRKSKIGDSRAPPHVDCYDPKAAAAIVLTLARAVHHAHQHGVLHRDIKPSNILIGASGTPHLTDFGLAKLAQKDSTLTHTNAILGTPSYMAPEQARGETKSVTTAADVYGLGAVLYACLTGEPPFAGGTSFETIRRVLEHEPRPPSSLNRKVDPDLETICLKCLEKEPARRCISAEALAEDLERWLRHEPILARPSTRLERSQKWVRRRPAITGLAASLVLALLAGAYGVVREWRRAEGNAQTLRDHLYAADMRIAFHASEAGRIEYARQLLETNRPRGMPDPRGFEWRYLYGVSRPRELAIFGNAPQLGIWGSALDPKDRFLAAGHGGGAIDIWDLEKSSLLKSFQAAEGIVYGVAFSPDGELLASTMADSKHTFPVHLWRLRTLTLVKTLIGHTNMSTSVAFSPNGRLLASGSGWAYNPSEVGQLLFWDTVTGQKLFELKGHNCSVGWANGFSPDGLLFASAHGDGLVRIWNFQDQKVVQTLRADNEVLLSVKFSPDGKRVAAGDDQGTVRLWDLADPARHIIVGRHGGAVISLAFSPDGNLLAASGVDLPARVWNLQDLRRPALLAGHADRVWSISFSSNGTRIATGSSDGTARLWRVPSPGDFVPYRSLYGSGVVFSPDGRWLVRELDGQPTFWDTRLGTDQFTISPALLGRTNSSWSGYNFAPDGIHFITVGPERGFHFWRITNAEPVHVQSILTPGHLRRRPIFCPSRNWMALKNGLTALSIWDTVSWKEIRTLQETDDILSYEWSPDGEVLAMSLHSGESHLWQTSSWTKRRKLGRTARSSGPLTFSPDGRWLAVKGSGNTGLLYEIATDTIYNITSDSGWVMALAFSADSKTLAVGTLSGEVKLYHIATCREMISFKAHSTVTTELIFSPDGRWLVSGGEPATRFWSAPDLTETDMKTSEAVERDASASHL
jgi:eukaryotic-like serine/threonine-protein kinase